MHITKLNKPLWKGYRLYDSNHITFWKRKNYGDSKRSVDAKNLGEEKDEWVEHGEFLGQ